MTSAPGTVIKRLKERGVLKLLLAAVSLTFAAGTSMYSQSLCPVAALGYKYQKTITIDGSKVSGSLTNFPVLIHITDPDLTAHALDANGFDIIFSDLNYNRLHHDLESFDKSTGELIVWVQIPSLVNGENTQIRMLYGNPQISSTQSSEGTWDGNYSGVWHLSNNLLDATSNGNDGINSGASTVPGKISNGGGFVASGDYISVGTTNWSASSGTIETWALTNGVSTGSKGFLFGHTTLPPYANLLQLYFTENSFLEMSMGLGANPSQQTGILPADLVWNKQEWYHIVQVWDGANYKVFVNGESRTLDGLTYTGLSELNTFADIGNDGNPGARNEGWNGIIDEFRVSKAVRSADWIKTEYTNQNNPATFISIGAEAPCSVYSFNNACSGGPILYSVPDTPGHDYFWTVTGGTPSATTGNAISVTWSAIGPFNIQLTENNGTCIYSSLNYSLTSSDIEKPVINCPAAITRNTDPGLCTASVSVPDASYSDNCSVTTLTWVMTGSTFASSDITGINPVGTHTFNRGATTVTYTATDGSGNSSSCNFTVTVEDHEIPQAVCKNISIYLDLLTGSKNILASDVDNGSSDNCGPVTFSVDKSSFTCSELGTNNVTLTVTDGAGNKATCTAAVTVTYELDPDPAATPPSDIICNGETTNLLLTNIIPSTWGWTVTGPPEITGWSDDLSGTKTAIQQTLNNSGVIAYKVVYTVIPRAYDACDLAPIIVDVWVEPTPQTTISSDVSTLCSGSPINVTINSPSVTTLSTSLSYTVSVTSTNPGSLGGTASTVVSPLSKAQLPYIITGTLTNSSSSPIDVTYTVIPKLNFCSDGPSQSVKITVIPNVAVPVILDCPANVTVQTGTGRTTCDQTATWTEPTALVGCSGTMSYTTRSHAPGDTFPVGSTPVTYTFISGLNTSTCTFNVIVQDNAPPVISGCPSDITVQTDAGRLTCNQVVSWVEPAALDNCPGVVTVTKNHAPGDTFPVGSTAVTYTFKDAYLNTTICTFNIVVQDNTPPLISGCPTDITVQTGVGRLTCDQIVSWVEPTALDNCSGAVTATRNHAPGDTFPVGSTAVTYTFKDASLNTSTCTFNVVVQDNTPPVISGCPTDKTVQTGAGRLTCDQVVSWIEPTVVDNCSGAVTITRNHAPGDTFPVGSTAVTYTFKDVSLNTSVCTFNVIVQDNTPPIIIDCPSNITQSNDAGRCSAVVTWTEPTASDNCTVPGSLVWTKSAAPGTIFPVGTTTVSYKVTDLANNVSSVCSFTVKVTDTEKPVITGCPANITQPSEPGKTTAVVTWAEPTATDNCTASNNLIWTKSHIPGSIFPVGITTVTYTVTDAANNVSNACNFTVRVTDAESPVITCPVIGQQNVTTNNGCTFIKSGTTWDATAIDNIGVTSLTYDLTGVTTGTGTSLNNVIFNIGVTTVTWTAKDEANNEVTCSYTVSVSDNINPVIVCPVDSQQDVTTNNLCTYVHSGTEWNATATDNCSVTLLTYTLTGVTAGTGTTLNNVAFNEGVTTVTWTAKDAANNLISCSFSVAVRDVEKPVINNCPANIIQFNDAGACGRVVTWTEPTATDNCTVPGNLIWTKSHSSGSFFPVGITTVTYTATDAANNVSNICSFTITVIDNEKPTPICKNISILLDLVSGSVTISPDDIDGGSFDNCGPISLAIDKTNFTCSDIGANNVTLSVTDAAGNQSTCTAVVTVNYALVPDPIVSPSTSIICNGETTNLILNNLVPTSWTWTVSAPPQITGWSDDLSGTKTSIQQTLTNSGNIAYKVIYTIFPKLYNTCNWSQITAEVWIEPTPQASISTSTPIICNGGNINLNINSLTVSTTPGDLSYVVSVFSTNPGSLGGSASTGITVFKANLPYSLTGTLTNNTDDPIIVTYTVTPKLNFCSDGPSQSLTVTVNPTPRVIPVNNIPAICFGGTTEILLTTPTTMTSGEIQFDYTVTFTGVPGDVTGNNAPGNNLLPGQKIIYGYQNSALPPRIDEVNSVLFAITPKVVGLGCNAGNTVISEVKVHPKTIQYNYAGTDGTGILITKPLTCETSTELASLKVILSSGADPYQISWTGPIGYTNNTAEIINLNVGKYTVNITDNLGCSNESSKTIVNFTARPQIVANIKFPNIHVSCPGGNDGSLQVYVLSGITQPYNYWVIFNDTDTIGNGVFFNSIDVDPNAFMDYNNLKAGVYKIVIRDKNGCEVSRTTELKEPAPIVVGFQNSNYNGFNVSCPGYSNGSALAVPTGGNGSYSYHWYPAVGSLSVSTSTSLLDSVPAGKYYVITTDQLNCTKTDSVTLIEPEGIQLTGSEVSLSNDGNTNISCNNGSDGSIKLMVRGGSGTYYYNWSGPNGYTANTKDISDLKAGNYTCTITDNNGCILVPSPIFTLTEPTALQISGISSISNYGSYNINCNGGIGSVNITVSGGSSGLQIFDWSTLDGSGIVAGQKDQNSLTAGSYHLRVTDSNGCIALQDVTLTQPPPLGTLLIPTHITCQSPDFNNGSIDFTASGGVAPYSYLWSNGATTEDITGLTQGYYTITLTDINGCTKKDSVRVNLPPPLSYTRIISDYNGFNISCNGLSNGSINITPTSGLAPFIYLWTGPSGFTATTKDISNLKAGQYSLLITDKNFCTAAEIINVTEPGRFGMKITLSSSVAGGFNINCSGESSGSINIESVNQVKTVNYLWADGIFGKTRTNLPAGNYSVILIDDNNCNADSSITITEPDPLKLVFKVTNPFCADKPDGEILLNVTGGVVGTDYIYKWSDGSSAGNRSNILPGLYKVTVNDLNGCSLKDSVKIDPLNEICLKIPNAISPNGDLINDVWNIGLIELYPQIEIKIFNRWGESVWRSDKGYTRPWDGTSNGSPLPIDSYHYIIDLHNGSKPLIGNITIMR